MKKVLNFALVALLALPLMMSCKPKNDPDNPDNPENHAGTEEWFEKWTEGNAEDKVPIKEENLHGIWAMAARATIHKDSVAPLGGIDYSNVTDMGYFVEIRKDETCTLYQFEENGLVKDECKWSLDTKSGEILFYDNMTWSTTWALLDGTYAVELLEEKRLVLSQPRWDNPKEKEYLIYLRIDKLPELPKTNTEILVGNSWKVVSDSVYTFKYVDGKEGFIVEEVVEVKTVNQFKDVVLTFKANGGLYAEDANGNLIKHCKYSVRQDTGINLLVDILTEDGQMAEKEEEDLIIPGLRNFLYFFPIRQDEKIAKLEYTSNTGQDYIFIAWRYHLEAVK